LDYKATVGVVVVENRCKQCLKVKAEMGGNTPVGYSPFAWGPSTEVPPHFYVLPTDTPVPAPGELQQVFPVKLCEIKNPVRR